jgi:hypothetical protein
VVDTGLGGLYPDTGVYEHLTFCSVNSICEFLELDCSQG